MNKVDIQITEANLDERDHVNAVLAMTRAYAEDAMGNGGPLPQESMDRLIPGLRAHPTTMIFLAFDGESAVGIATCFLGFSTFAGRPLINLHDLSVLKTHRGTGIGRRLLAAVEEKARSLGCARVTLEVQEGNRRARSVYESAGFSQAGLDEGAGGALFYSKDLD